LELGVGTLKQTITDDIVRVAEVCSLMYDLMDRIGATVTVFASPAARLDEKKKHEMREELKAHVFPRIFGGLERTLQPNGYVVGNSISAADLLVQRACKWLTAGVLDGIPTTCLDAYEKTRKCVQNVDEHPRVKEYYANKQQQQQQKA
jgi:glutathione S-transferase